MIAAEPYPWPYDGTLHPGQLALVVAGAQAAWAERSVCPAEVAAKIETVAIELRSVGALVVHVRHSAPTGRRHDLPPPRGTPGWALATEPDTGDIVVDAGGIDGFYASALDRELRARSIRQLVFAGYGAEATVGSTVRSANDRGYECLTLIDACAPFQEDTGAHALSSITMSGGIFGAIATSDALLAALPVLEVR